MVKGIEQMRAKMRTHLAAATTAGKKSAKSQAEHLAQAMRFLAPVDDAELIKSISVEEIDSIKTRWGDSGFFGYSVRAGDQTTIVTNDSGAKFQNARLQEFGTHDRPASPFFYPAWRANRSRIRANIRAAISRAWRKGAP